MTKVITNTGGRKHSLDFKADVPMMKAPVIVSALKIGNEIFYKGQDGKLYIAAKYDAMFKPIKTKEASKIKLY